MKTKILLFAAVLFSLSATAQKDVTLTIKHKLGSNPFAFSQATTNNLNNNLNITRVDYYMSSFIIIHDGGMQLTVPASTIILVKGDNNVSANLGNFNVTNVEGIKFSIGVPAAVNNQDPAQWSAPNALAPQSPSMHWGWTAGFRFVAIEGNAGSTLSTSYEMHGLGNPNYFQQTVMAAGVPNGSKVFINLDADYTKALKDIDVTQGPIDHGVDAADLQVLKNFRDNVFSPGSGIPNAIANVATEKELSLYPNPSTGSFNIKTDNGGKYAFTNAQIFDLSGRMIKEVFLGNNNETEVSITTPGLYFVKLNSFGVHVATKKIVIQ